MYAARCAFRKARGYPRRSRERRYFPFPFSRGFFPVEFGLAVGPVDGISLAMDDGYAVRQVRAIFFGEGMNNLRVKGDTDRDNPAVIITGNR